MKHLIAKLACAAIFLACAAIFLVPGIQSALESTSRAAERNQSGTPQPVTLASCHILHLHPAILASDRPGVLTSVKFEEGDVVRKDETIGQLHDDVVKANLAIAKLQAENNIEVRYAIEAAKVAEKLLDAALKANSNYNVTAVPETEVDRLRLDHERAKLQIEKAKKDMDVFQLQLDKEKAELETYRVKAPFSGIVTNRYKSAGEAVQQGEPLVELVNTDYVKVQGFVNLDDLARIKAGSPVKVQLDLSNDLLEADLQSLGIEQDQPPIKQLLTKGDVPEDKLRNFDGILVFVDLSVTGTDGKIRVWAKVKNEDNVLRAGLRARMTIYAQVPKSDTTTAGTAP